MRSRAQPAPAWLVGHYAGTNSKIKLQHIELDVDEQGRVDGRVGELMALGQYIGSDRILWAHGGESVIERTASGFRAAQVRDPGNVTDYQRR